MPHRVALVGATGQLAFDLRRAWVEHAPDDRLIGLTHADVEVADLSSVRAALEAIRPTLVINTSAYHKVDVVEENPDRAFAVNATGPRNLALVCRDLDAVLLHMSTDYVFSGRKAAPYVEGDPVDPVNVYGVSKAAGEDLIRYLWPKHFIVRCSGLYGVAGSSGKGGNFVETMLRLAQGGGPICVVNDQTLTPTTTRALAGQLAVLNRTTAYGTYHATCAGQCTWFDFAVEIFRQADVSPAVHPQTSTESGAKARRPVYSVLENRNLKRLGLDGMPAWEDALAGYLAERNNKLSTLTARWGSLRGGLKPAAHFVVSLSIAAGGDMSRGERVASELRGSRREGARLGGMFAREATEARRGLASELPLAKRVLDVTVSAVSLMLLLPLMAATAAAVKLTSRGPIFYRWHVTGRNGRPFVGYKFRSMIVEADKLKPALLESNEMTGPVFKMTDDPRVTPVGRFLRKFSLDEFPQLWSVLKGDMSLVGPRPVAPEEWKHFEDWQRRKLSVTPGMICLWHVNGKPKDFDQWVKMDLEYIDTWSFRLDVKILAKGALYILLGRSC